MTSDYWSEHALEYSALFQRSKSAVLFPAIADLIRGHRVDRLLDYGCGDGRFLEFVPEGIEIQVYDPSAEMRALATRLVGSRLDCVHEDADRIPSDYFDAVVLSLVLVCISNEAEYIEVLRNIRRALRPGGIGIIAVTHPCFRPFQFSDFFTSYCRMRPFNYFAEGDTFGVTMTDTAAGRLVGFDDYHWPLSFTINRTIEAGLTLEKVVETRDDASASYFNPEQSPYLVLLARKGLAGLSPVNGQFKGAPTP